MIVKIVLNTAANPPGKVADAELHFEAGALAGLKLIGFGVWERRGQAGGYNVTLPARSYAVNGERRSFALLRPIAGDLAPSRRLSEIIINAYRQEIEPADPDTGAGDLRRVEARGGLIGGYETD